MSNWNSSPHPISDLRDWRNSQRLEVRPDFQRKEVWSLAAKLSLIDTILHDIPMPKFLVASRILDGNTHRTVIDGQQRIIAILGFLDDHFALKSPYEGEFTGLLFSQLPVEVQNKVLRYKLDFNEISDATDLELRNIYSRVNKYNIKLNKQELRRADYPGDFLDVSESLAQLDFFSEFGLFSAAQIRRNGDVEFTSELLLALLNGAQDKKATVDQAYEDYAKWETLQRERTVGSFREVLSEINLIFSTTLELRRTRFRQRADFYGLFLALSEVLATGNARHIDRRALEPLRSDFRLIDQHTRPSSQVRLFSEYGIKCSTDANSESSRRWRANMLREFVCGTYVGLPDQSTRERWNALIIDLAKVGELLSTKCKICNSSILDANDCLTAWDSSEVVFQVSNTVALHRGCYALAKTQWIPLLEGDA